MPRSRWKPLYIRPLQATGLFSPEEPYGSNVSQLENPEVCIVSRATYIDPSFLGRTVHIHTGKAYLKVMVTEGMLQRKFGEFALTRRLANHAKKTKKKKN